MRRAKRFLKFVKDITATEYSSDSDDQSDEPQFSNLVRIKNFFRDSHSSFNLLNFQCRYSSSPQTLS